MGAASNPCRNRDIISRLGFQCPGVAISPRLSLIAIESAELRPVLDGKNNSPSSAFCPRNNFPIFEFSRKRGEDSIEMESANKTVVNKR